MTLLRRSWLAVLLLAALFAVAAPAATARAQEGVDNGAVAINEEDGSSEIDIDFDLVQVLDGIVDQTNAAVAYASCEQCQTIAIAIQVVIVNSPIVGDVVPQNVALAINDGCLTCVTVALAYQIVIGRAERLQFTGEARRRLRQIAKALRRLERSDGSAQEVVDEVDRIMTDLGDVLSTGLRSAGPLRSDDDDDDDDERSDRSPEEDATPTPSPTATPPPDSAAPTATPTPEPTVTPTATPTPSATATPEPTPSTTPAP